MPKAMDSNQRHRVVLACDMDKNPTPTFIYPFLTGRQQRQMLSIYESIDDGNAQADNISKAFDMASMFLRGWEHITHPDTGEPMEFDPKRLDEVCSVLEAMELSQRVMFGQTLDLMDKKKLDSPSESDTADSVKPAAAPTRV